uniref:Putative secreted peptide n=1 Tax=Anopheles braziliensis TaxID=58242 RepID=A0A2M3ZTS5_9DIPT
MVAPSRFIRIGRRIGSVTGFARLLMLLVPSPAYTAPDLRQTRYLSWTEEAGKAQHLIGPEVGEELAHVHVLVLRGKHRGQRCFQLFRFILGGIGIGRRATGRCSSIATDRCRRRWHEIFVIHFTGGFTGGGRFRFRFRFRFIPIGRFRGIIRSLFPIGSFRIVRFLFLDPFRTLVTGLFRGRFLLFAVRFGCYQRRRGFFG